MKKDLSDFSSLDAMRNHPVSGQIDQIFKSVIKEEKHMSSKKTESAPLMPGPGELSLGEIGELDIGLSMDDLPPDAPIDHGMELSLDEGETLDLGDTEYIISDEDSDGQYGDLPLEAGEEESVSLTDEGGQFPQDEDFESFSEGTMSVSLDQASIEESLDEGLSLADFGTESHNEEIGIDQGLSLLGDDELSLSDNTLSGPQGFTEEVTSLDEDLSLEFNAGEDEAPLVDKNDLSDDALEKLKEIDEIMEFDASQVNIQPQLEKDKDLNEPLVSPDLNLASINFGSEDEAHSKEEKPKRKKKEEASLSTASAPAREREMGAELREISGAYSGEMERMQATISNLRTDREELLLKIQTLEEDKVLQARQTLSFRAELDERKIELVIIRKKLNEEINDLKDRLKLYDEKRLILEEKNRILLQELDKAAQKNKIDVKKVQMRERELEQKLELLKSDAETQIRNRDLKILELKRKIDAMEFDMESISQQEKRSVESRFELEDKLEKAIKTLRSAITVLEDESDRSNALSALKKNIDM
jgi:hypothetical protein